MKKFQRALLAWYDKNRRDLPWRIPFSRPARGSCPTTPHPYQVLLSEAMLQQTQVATVIPYFHRFLARFPTLSDLASADQQEVLRLWQGLGYYSRARNLHACAQKVMTDHDGEIPSEVDALLNLPGIGRYTAGAIASLAYDRRAPILDGNVMRVLCRIDQIETDPRERAIQARLWSRAKEILPQRRVGDFNSALMELGAMVCTPKNPQCPVCPVNQHCQAAASGIQDRIPIPKKSKPIPRHVRYVLCIRHSQHFLIEQRPSKGRWGGMWQFKTLQATKPRLTTSQLKAHLGLTVSPPRRLGVIRHSLTHRHYEFDAYEANLLSHRTIGQVWVTLGELDSYPLSKPQLSIAKLLKVGPV